MLLAGWRLKKSATTATAAQKELRSYLHGVRWHRVVLLDAEQCANATKQRAKACQALHAERRWAVSGPGARLGRGKGLVDPAALLPLVGVAAGKACCWRGGGAAGRLVRERRGELGLLHSRGYEDIGEQAAHGVDDEDDAF